MKVSKVPLTVMTLIALTNSAQAETRRCPVCDPPNAARQFPEPSISPSGSQISNQSSNVSNNGSSMSANDIRLEAEMAAQKRVQQANQTAAQQPNQNAALADLRQGVDQVPQGKQIEELGAAIHSAEQRSSASAQSASSNANSQGLEYTGGGRNNYTRGQEYTNGNYRVGHDTTSVTVRASQGDIGSVHAVSGGPFGSKTHTTAHPDGSFHHHGEHRVGRDNEFSNN